jgi:hypothetical protein
MTSLLKQTNQMTVFVKDKTNGLAEITETIELKIH